MDDHGNQGQFHVHRHFRSSFLDNSRTLTVWLPPGYEDQPDDRYPVLYLHDGQNLFDAGRAAYGVSWDAHVTAARLINADRLHPLILVGIDNTEARLDEYAIQVDASEKAGGRGADYARFLLDEVKPFIDATYRTQPDRRHTGVVGASMGGLISLAMARLHYDRFALCGALSPSLWWGRGKELRALEADLSWMKRMRFWLDMGTREGTAGIKQTRRLLASFDEAGLIPGRHYYYWEAAGGEHNETAWSARFDKLLRFFFGR